jgi:hypothetical protein
VSIGETVSITDLALRPSIFNFEILEGTNYRTKDRPRIGTRIPIVLDVTNIGEDPSIGTITVEIELLYEGDVANVAFVNATGTCGPAKNAEGNDIIRCRTDRVLVREEKFQISFDAGVTEDFAPDPDREDIGVYMNTTVSGGGDCCPEDNGSYLLLRWLDDRGRRMERIDPVDLEIMTTPARPASWEER